MTADFDYIIVGSGAGGSTLAYRLAQSGRNHRVLVLEYGREDSDPLHRIPKAQFATAVDERYTYRYSTGPIAGSQTAETWTRGKIVGGSTTVNGMIYSRGQQPDFDRLAAVTGSRHWGWDNAVAAYRAMEDHELGASTSRGAGGPFAVSAAGADDELAERLFSAGKRLGWEPCADLNDSDVERIGYTPTAVRHGLRTSAASAFLRPALQAGVTLETGVQAERILIAGGRAVAVAARRGRSAVTFRARKEIIVACGAIESPLLLERSGIGHPDLLRRIGIEPVVASLHVGEGVREHHMTMVQVRFRRRLGIAEQLAAELEHGFHPKAYLQDPGGLLASSGYDVTFHAKSAPSQTRPDLVGSVAPFTIDPTAAGLMPAYTPGMLIGVYQTRPETTSAVHASGPDPVAPPAITPRYFETQTDQAVAGQTLQRVRDLLGTESLAEIIAGEDFPTDAVTSDPESALAYARHHGATVSHAVGSCAMGPADDHVLDPELRVRGVDGLRVVDASALPFHVSSHPMAAVMALAWLGHDLFD